MSPVIGAHHGLGASQRENATMGEAMNTEVQNFLASHTFSEATKHTYSRVLEELTRHDTTSWSASDLLSFVQREKWGNATQYLNLAACRKFIAWKHGANHPATFARLKRIKGKQQRALTMEQVIELLASFDPHTAKGARDLALAALAIDTGLRASELARVKLTDMDRERTSLQVIVKGGQWGFAFYSPETANYIEKWIAFRKPAEDVDNLFVSLRQSKDQGKALTVHGIKITFKRWGLKLGFKLSPHDARRTFATVSTILGAPSRIVQAAGRWSNIEMVERYTHGIDAQAIAPYLPISHAVKRQG